MCVCLCRQTDVGNLKMPDVTYGTGCRAVVRYKKLMGLWHDPVEVLLFLLEEHTSFHISSTEAISATPPCMLLD